MEPKRGSKASLSNPPDATGGGEAMDLAVNPAQPGLGAAASETERFSSVLGAAAIALWSDLPRPIQEQLFERAVVLGHRDERDEMLREQLAKFLHDHHKRTTGGD
jgi:hypothetical protein